MKRKVTSVLTAVMVLMMSIIGTNIETTAATEVVWGDVDMNGHVDANDAQATLMKFLDDAMETPEDSNSAVWYNWALADVDGNGKLTAMDAQNILTKYLEIIMGNPTFYFPVESPIAYREIRVHKNWDVYKCPNNSEDCFYGIVTEQEVLQVVEFVGNDWYKIHSEFGEEFYMNIPKRVWNVDITYNVAEVTTTNTTKVATTLPETTVTEETTTTATDAKTTTIEETTATQSTTGTETTTTTTTATETTTTDTTTDSIRSFDVGDKLKFNAVAWIIYNDDANETRLGYLQNGDTFTILGKSRYVDSYRYKIKLENGTEAIIYIAETKFFEKV